jgi:hypothetical protein
MRLVKAWHMLVPGESELGQRSIRAALDERDGARHALDFPRGIGHAVNIIGRT